MEGGGGAQRVRAQENRGWGGYERESRKGIF